MEKLIISDVLIDVDGTISSSEATEMVATAAEKKKEYTGDQPWGP